MNYGLRRKIKILSKILFILAFFRLLFWIKSSTTLLIFVSTIIYKLLRKPRKALAYPEIHYVLARRLSLIYRHYPEVVTDAPWRVKAGKNIPILCMIKDADEFTTQLRNIMVHVQGDGFSFENPLQYPDDRIMRLISSLDPGRSITPKKGLIDTKFWYSLGYISIPQDYVGPLELTPKVHLISEKRRFFRYHILKQNTVFTDNLPMLSHAPLRVYVSKHELPSFDGWYYGDAHCHSDRTDNQTEFGAPPAAIRTMGKAIGLKWGVITDHSFDLDVPVNRFHGKDPKKIRWKSLGEEIDLTNCLLDDFFLMRGEEISCGNANEENIHLLCYGVPEFIPGRGDGCKDQAQLYDFSNPPDITLTDALKIIDKNGGVAFAAHPDSTNHRLAKFFINRGNWQDEDCKLEGCLGLQVWDSCNTDDTFEKSSQRWVNFLLDGYKKYIIAGSDAHGDFNRYRYVKHPFIKLKERMDSYFGKPRTCVYCGQSVNEETILDGLRKGRTVVTDGPIAIFELQRDDGKKAMIGETISGKKFDLTLRTKSTDEFGELQQAIIYKGELSKRREIVWAEIDLTHENDRYSHVSKYPITIRRQEDKLKIYNELTTEDDFYIRVELVSKRKDRNYHCLTNPIWVGVVKG